MTVPVHLSVSKPCTCLGMTDFTFRLPSRQPHVANKDVASALLEAEEAEDEDNICRGCNHLSCEMDIWSFSFCLTEDNDVHPCCNAKLSLSDTKTTASATSSSTRRKFRVEIPHCKQNLQCRIAALNWFDQYMLKNGVGEA